VTPGPGNDIDGAFATLAQMRPDAVLIATATLFLEQRAKVAKFAADHRVPTMFGMRDFVEVVG